MEQLNIFEQANNPVPISMESYVCDHCGAKHIYYKKPLIGVAVAELIKLYRLWKIENQSIHINRFSKQRSNFYTLKYWGLIIGSEKVEGKRTAGLWGITQKGIDFVQNHIEIPSYAITINNACVQFTGENINVITALKKKFDYDELING